MTSIAARSMNTAAQSKEGKRNGTNRLDCERHKASKTRDSFDSSQPETDAILAPKGRSHDSPGQIAAPPWGWVCVACFALSGVELALNP
jgi:hypothetical protein